MPLVYIICYRSTGLKDKSFLQQTVLHFDPLCPQPRDALQIYANIVYTFKNMYSDTSNIHTMLQKPNMFYAFTNIY